jgi:hypothetical protein
MSSSRAFQLDAFQNDTFQVLIVAGRGSDMFIEPAIQATFVDKPSKPVIEIKRGGMVEFEDNEGVKFG